VPNLDPAAWRRTTLGRAWIAVVLVVGDLALLVLVSMMWYAAALDWLSGADIAAFNVLGGSAAVGVAVLPVVALANLRAVRALWAGAPLSRAIRLGSVGLWLTLLRLAGLVVAGAAVIAAIGVTGDSVLTDGCALGIALVDGLFAVLVASATQAGLRRGAA